MTSWRLLFAGSASVLVVMVLVGCSGLAPAEPVPIAGIVRPVIDTSNVLSLANPIVPGSSCDSGAEPSIAAGGQVVLSDEGGAIIGTASLSSGKLVQLTDIPANVRCEMSFEMEAKSLVGDFFTLSFGSRGFEVVLSRDELLEGPEINVGDDYWH